VALREMDETDETSLGGPGDTSGETVIDDQGHRVVTHIYIYIYISSISPPQPTGNAWTILKP
jgi:hypothetical protein